MAFLAPLVLSWTLGVLLVFLDGRRRWVGAIAMAGLAIVLAGDLALAMALRSGGTIETVAGGWPAGIGIRLRADLLTALVAATSAVVLVAVMARELLERAEARAFPALVLLLSAGLHGVYFTGDAFSFYVFFELSMIASFVLAGYGWGRAELRATLLFVVVNVIGSIAFLSAVASLYHVTGTLDLEHAAERAADQDVGSLLVIGALLLAAFSLKLGLFPFHYWVPVVYRDTHPAVAAAFAGALVNIGTYGLLRFGFGVFQAELEVARPVLFVLGGASTVFGTLLALGRRKSAEVAAYASVAHAGYLMLAIGIGGREGALAAILLLIAGSFDKAAIFLALRDSCTSAHVSALIGALSAAGIPITLGFVAKLQLLRAAMDDRASGMLIAVILLASMLALGLVIRLWRGCPGDPAPGPARAPGYAAALGLGILIVGLGAAAAPLDRLASVAAAGLMGE